MTRFLCTHRNYIVVVCLLAAGCGSPSTDQKTDASIRSDKTLSVRQALTNREKRPPLASSKAYFDRSIQWAAQGDYESALADLDEAARLDPSDSKIFFTRGRIWTFKEDFDKAITQFNESIRLNPNDGNVFFNRGIAWAEKGVHSKAIADYSKAIKSDPNRYDAHFNLASSLQDLGEFGKAIEHFEKAMELNRNDSNTHVDLAITYVELAMLHAACPAAEHRDGKKALVLAKKSCEMTEFIGVHALTALACAHAELGNFQKAVFWIKRAELQLPSEEESAFRTQYLELFEQDMPYREEPRQDDGDGENP